MSDRLSSIAPDLAEVFASAPPSKLEAISRRAAEWAAATVGLQGPQSSAALELLAVGRVGASPERLALERYAEELDEQAWDVQQRIERDKADEAEYLHVFSQARAASAICFALHDDPRVAALEAVYEAYAATGALHELRAVVIRARTER